MNPQKVIIIGTGAAAFHAAASLRLFKFEGDILMIGKEKGLPYHRPPLSKAFLKEGNEEKLLIRSKAFFEKKNIQLLDETTVTEINRSTREVITNAGKKYAYDHLILATGTSNNRPPIEGLSAENVVFIRTLDEAKIIKEKLGSTQQAIIIGGGFIGLEFASVARTFDIKTTVVEGTTRLMSRAVSASISDFFLQKHLEQGTEVRLNVFAKKIVTNEANQAIGVELADGSTLKGDLVLVAAGVYPNIRLATEAGLKTDNGIVVNEQLLTSDKHISAIGDCAAFPNPDSGEQIRLESVQAATDHARTVAHRLVGNAKPYDAVPWFWSDQVSCKLQMAGLTNSCNHFIEKNNPEADEKVVFCFEDNILKGVETVNAPVVHMQARKVLKLYPSLTLAALESIDFDLKRHKEIKLSEQSPRSI